MQQVCESCLFLKNETNILSVYLLSVNEKWHFDGSFLRDSKHIVHLKALSKYYKVFFLLEDIFR